MLGQLFFSQWKWNRDLLAFFIVVGFAIPLIMLWIAMPMLGQPGPSQLMEVGGVIGAGCLTVALLAGGAVAAQGYGADDRGGHVYALSLPVSRARFLAGRAVAAFALLTLPALGVWLGSMLAAGQVEVPATIRPYPGSLALRTLFAAWLAHCGVFALRYGAGRRAKGVFLALLLGSVGIFLLARFTAPAAAHALSSAAEFLISHPGPFGVFFGRWTLFDV